MNGISVSKVTTADSSLDPTHLDINLVAAKHDRDRLANALHCGGLSSVSRARARRSLQALRTVTVPVGHVLVGDFGCDIEHDDTALTLRVTQQSM